MGGRLREVTDARRPGPESQHARHFVRGALAQTPNAIQASVLLPPTLISALGDY